MRTYKRKDSLIYDSVVLNAHSYKCVSKLLEVMKKPYYKRETANMIDIIWGNRQFLHFKDYDKKQMFGRSLFLFRLVMDDANKFLKTKKLKAPKIYPSTKWNENYAKINYRITATDLNHAYWRIAFHYGIISENTYKHGLKNNDFKTTRLMALSTLGREKIWDGVNREKGTPDKIRLLGEPKLQDLYFAIRNKCYWHMEQMRKLLGADFICYRTDCIYYTDTKENRKKIRDYCKKYKLDYKQLVGDKNKSLYKL